MFVQTEPTPNPATLKFLPGKEVMKDGTMFYQNQESASNSPLAMNLFNIKGVEGVFIGPADIAFTLILSLPNDAARNLVLASRLAFANPITL